MNKEKIIKELLSGIEDLERSGDLVVTTTIPEKIAASLYQTLRDKWCDLEDGVLPPPEVRIESSMEASAKHLERVFNLSDTEAKSTVLGLYNKMSKTKSDLDIADYYSHEGPLEIALTAYFCIKLDKERFYETGYIEWRQHMYKEISQNKLT